MNSAGEIRHLGEPRLRSNEVVYEPYAFEITTTLHLPVPDAIPSEECLQVLHKRRSRRKFGRLDQRQLSALLWFSAKTLYRSVELSGFPWSHRPSPSAGGRHPIQILVLNAKHGSADLSLYEPELHALHSLRQSSDPKTIAFIATLDAVVPSQQGTILWFTADYLRTLSRYDQGESLVWRDAGALLGTIAVAAEALQLNCCAYGLTGDDWIATMFPRNRFGGAGGCVIGSR